MKVIFCAPKLTMTDVTEANVFYDTCLSIIKEYDHVENIDNENIINRMIIDESDPNDIFVFFNSETGIYKSEILRLINKFVASGNRVWCIAMEKNPECRMPPEPVKKMQSFDVYCRKDKNNPLNNNIKAIAHIFARKIIAQTLSPLYKDTVTYFISHRRKDGEDIAANLADALRNLTKEINTFRDVIDIEVGDDAQEVINEKLITCDLVIFLQTPCAYESENIMGELSHAIVNNVPVLWIQIDNASADKLRIRPGDKPVLKYTSKDFSDMEHLKEIAFEVEKNCFKMIMNSSSNVYSYVECLMDIKNKGKMSVIHDFANPLSFEIKYEKIDKRYEYGSTKNYIRCFGRNPKDSDLKDFVDSIKDRDVYDKNDRLLLLSCHGKHEIMFDDEKVWKDNIEDYVDKIYSMVVGEYKEKNKKIIISGAFPDCDEIYKSSLLEAVMVYSKQIIKNGYILVFGAHPTFQNLIFDIGKNFSSDVKYSIEMHMSKEYLKYYKEDELREIREKCTLVLSDNLEEMRNKMIRDNNAEMLICLGGKIKEDKSQQGVDIEVKLAQKSKIPVALIGTVGGRSSEYAHEMIGKDWSLLNSWGKELNEELFYNVNHRLMINKLLEKLSGSADEETQ